MDANSIIESIKAQLASTGDKISNSGIYTKVKEALVASKNELQDVLNNILAKKGVLTQSDVDAANAAIRKAKQDELDAEAKKYKHKFIMLGIGVAVFAGGLYLYFHHKKSK